MRLDTDPILFEDDIKYEAWVKALMAGSVILVVVLGILFSMNAHGSNIFPREPARESQTASIILFASAVFILAVFWFALPREIFVSQAGIRIKHGGFTWNIPFAGIKAIRASRGLIVWWGYGSLTSYGNQIEIVKKSGFKIRVCPSRRDEFLEHANRALNGWTGAHPSGNNS